jgi:hypothetical protein
MKKPTKIYANRTLQSSPPNSSARNFITYTNIMQENGRDVLNAKGVYICWSHWNLNSKVFIAIQICHNGRNSKPSYVSLLFGRTSRHNSRLGKVARCKCTTRESYTSCIGFKLSCILAQAKEVAKYQRYTKEQSL